MSKINSNFQQFIKKEDKGARLKEKIRQEKKKVRQETKEYFAQQKRGASPRIEETAPQRENEAPQRTAKAFRPARAGKQSTGRPASGRPSASRPQNDHDRHDRRSPDRTPRPSPIQAAKPVIAKPAHKNSGIKPAAPTITRAATSKGPVSKDAVSKEEAIAEKAASSLMPLNKFIAHSGICSRRDAAEVVRSGKISVNGQVVTEPGSKVSEKDDIRMQGKKISSRKQLVYILLNKPKDHITTTEDPEGRKTVMDIVRKATTERVYPVGRLDRNTTGVLILTNDGELAQKLSHPSYEVRKIYEVTLDRPLLKRDFDALLNGITLEDGFIAPDSLAYADSNDRKVIGIEIHSGRNRIVRRIFEKLGYDVRNLDRVMYANLTKKNVERGKWRLLVEKEVRLLKFMNASYARKH